MHEGLGAQVYAQGAVQGECVRGGRSVSAAWSGPGHGPAPGYRLGVGDPCYIKPSESPPFMHIQFSTCVYSAKYGKCASEFIFFLDIRLC